MRSRVPELDALRGVGALAILAFHLWPSTFFLGWSRVDLFFVMSGFLITSICLKFQNRPDFLWKFYARRWLRTGPAYLVLVAVVCLDNQIRRRGTDLLALASSLTWTQTTPLFWGARPSELHPFFEHTWCLMVEEQFYVIWPLLLGFLPSRSIVAVATGVVIGSVVARGCGVHPWLLAGRCDGLALGSILSVVVAGSRRARGLWPFFLITIVASGSWIAWALKDQSVRSASFSAPLSWHGSLTLFAANLFYLGLIGLVIVFSGHSRLGPLRWPWLRGIGTISYGVFLFHYPILGWYAETGRGEGMSLILDVDVAAICLAVGSASWVLVERPILDVRDRCRMFRYGSTSPASVLDHPPALED